MVKESDDIFVSIQTWEYNGLIQVGFEVAIERQRAQEAVYLSREETHELLSLEEECRK